MTLTIINDNARVTLQIVALLHHLQSSLMIIIYNHNLFIVQAADFNFINHYLLITDTNKFLSLSCFLGAMALSIKTPSIKTFSIKTLSITTFSITINKRQHSA
jgi:hypothetical protein